VAPGTPEIIEAHRAAGRRFEAAGVSSFVRDEGEGPTVVLLHGVPTSSFLYRKLLPELAQRGLRGLAFDFPGLGLADRPQQFDYSWSGLAGWTGAAIDALGVEHCHLVVHDIGGPIGFEWLIRNPDRVKSLTVLNTLVDAGSFRRPWPMHPFSIRGVGEAWLAGMRPPASRWIFRHMGLADHAAMSAAEIDAYTTLLKRGDGGRAFLRIMRGFELSDEKERFYREGLAGLRMPAQVVWGRDDPALGEERLRSVQEALGVDNAHLIQGRHFIQEDQAPAIADAVSALVAGS
jgi:haloalkane dehalogenase